MPSGKRISARDILKNIRAGMSPIGLMVQYDLTPRQLGLVFDKLISRELLTATEFEKWKAGEARPIDEQNQGKPGFHDVTSSEPPELNHSDGQAASVKAPKSWLKLRFLVLILAIDMGLFISIVMAFMFLRVWKRMAFSIRAATEPPPLY